MNGTHIVESGESLIGIATANGVTLGEILQANPKFTKNGRSPNQLHPGEEVSIPAKKKFSRSIDVKTGQSTCLNCPTSVEFAPVVPGTKCGWDPASSIPWKSLRRGQQNTVKATIVPEKNVACVKFESSNASVKVSPATAAAASQTLTLTGVSAGEAEIKATCNGATLGSFKVRTYDFSLPAMVADSKRKAGFNADGTIANDMKYGDYSNAQIEALGFMFKLDALAGGLGSVSAESLFRDMRRMSKDLFAMDDLEENIDKMIDRFKGNTGGTYSNASLTSAVREHASNKRFVEQIRKGLEKAINDHKGDIGKLTKNMDVKLIGHPVFNSSSDIASGLTIAINDTWAYEVSITAYELFDRCYKGEFNVTLYDHFGLDQPDVEKKYSYLVGFRSWFILQHLQRFSYKPFITEVKMIYPFEGHLS
jgi:LysM repeat protein